LPEEGRGAFGLGQRETSGTKFGGSIKSNGDASRTRCKKNNKKGRLGKLWGAILNREATSNRQGQGKGGKEGKVFSGKKKKRKSPSWAQLQKEKKGLKGGVDEFRETKKKILARSDKTQKLGLGTQCFIQ